MQTPRSFLLGQRPSMLRPMFASFPFQLLKPHRLRSIGFLLIICIATGIAYGQSTPGQATVTITIDNNNCQYAIPEGGWIQNSGQIFITINNTETESAIYSCVTA